MRKICSLYHCWIVLWIRIHGGFWHFLLCLPDSSNLSAQYSWRPFKHSVFCSLGFNSLTVVKAKQMSGSTHAQGWLTVRVRVISETCYKHYCRELSLQIWLSLISSKWFKVWASMFCLMALSGRNFDSTRPKRIDEFWNPNVLILALSFDLLYTNAFYFSRVCWTLLSVYSSLKSRIAANISVFVFISGDLRD